MNAKTIIAVIIVAVLIGVLYVVFEKNFMDRDNPAEQVAADRMQTAQPLPDQPDTMALPTPEPTLPPINGDSNLLEEASTLQMRDYSSMFEDLKNKVRQ
jgi:hypothetical protein